MLYSVKVKHFGISNTLLLFLLAGLLPVANASITPGSKCSKVGFKQTVSGITYTCKKSGSKLVWSEGIKAPAYDQAFARNLLLEAQAEATKILSKAKADATQIASPPKCSTRYAQASASIGADRNTLLSLIFENPTVCDLTVRATAAFLCPDGKVQKLSNYVTSTGVFPIGAGERFYINLNIENYFPQVRTDCRLLTGYSGSPSISTYHQAPRVETLTANFTGEFDQVAATKKANSLLKEAKARADKIVADAKNPTLIAKAWEGAVKAKMEAEAQALAQKKAASEAAEACAKSGRDCRIGDTGPGGGIVFYDAGQQELWGRYLEFAPSGWFGTKLDPTAEWCDSDGVLKWRYEYSPEGKKTLDIGAGKSNTDTMLSFCTSGAAIIARSYKGMGKDDWSLPSSRELLVLCEFWFDKTASIGAIGAAICGGSTPRTDSGYSGGLYWSSTRYSNETAQAVEHWSPAVGRWMTNIYYIRPIRAF